MTKYGYILEESETDPARLPEAILALPRAIPDVVPVWTRFRELPGFDLRHTWLENLRAQGIEPIVYAETTGMHPLEILAGNHDDAFKLLAARARGALIRILHEPNGHLFEWSSWLPGLYKDVWRRLWLLIHGEGARMLYCVVHRGPANQDDMFRHWPGAEWVDAVGFDEFRRADKETLPPRRWASAIEAFEDHKFSAPIYVCETGAIETTSQRAKFIASFAQVEGVAGILCFDRRIVVPAPPALTPIDDEFSWGLGMVREWDKLPREV